MAEKKRKPPAFRYLPESRAKRLKKSWIEDHKMRSRWKAQKKREGLTSQTSAAGSPSNRRLDETDTGSEPPDLPGESPPRNKQSLRDLRRIAYASKSSRAQETDVSRPREVLGRSHNDRGRKAVVGRESGQPNMKLRMNVVLEQIKRDFV